MPRKRRPLAPNALYHVTAHVVADHQLFQDDEDRTAYLSFLDQAVHKHDWSCTGYCLMDTHVHVLVQTPTPTLSEGMQAIQSRYAQRHNRRLGRRGPVWDGRFAAELIERDEHYLEALRYVPLNPVRAGMCDDPADWPWSSHRAMAGLEAPPQFLDVDAALGFVGVFGRRQDPEGYLGLLAGADRLAPATLAALTRRRSELAVPVTALPTPAATALAPADLVQLHRQDRRSLRDLAGATGCHPSTVLRRIRRHEAAAQRV